MKNIDKNLLSCTLDVLKIKYTKKNADKYFNEHPHKYNMFGLSKMLSYYGVENYGIKIINKNEEIYTLETPFIAHIDDFFIVVEDVLNNNISYYKNNQKQTTPLSDFLSIWTGNALLIKKNEYSIEPDYYKNKKEELIRCSQKKLLFGEIGLISLLGVIQSKLYLNLGLSILLLLNLVGLYIGYMLILKQMKIKSSNADKICSLLGENNCDDILNSPAAKFIGSIGWSEIGFCYFLSNIFIILFFPELLFYLALINVCTLPYTIWSIWYQKFRAKQWCVLCLMTQGILWCIYTINLLFDFIQIANFSLFQIIYVMSIYVIPLLIISLLLPEIKTLRDSERIKYELNSLKMDEDLFLFSLRKRPKHNVDKSTSTIYFGNLEAKNLITIFTNPHCDPCARMHKRIENFLFAAKEKFCIQYMLSSFNESLEESNKFLLSINKNMSQTMRNKIYDEWFNGGKYNTDYIFEKYKVPMNDVEKELDKHNKWKEKENLSSTPTVLFQGYELPDNYELEDLIYFTDLDVNSK